MTLRGMHEKAFIPGSPSAVNAYQNQTENGPVSNTIRSTYGARLRTSWAIVLGSETHLPRHIRLPLLRIETEVSFIDTSGSIYSAKTVPPWMLGPAIHCESLFSSYRETVT